jgi:hypothetical protein
VKKKNPAEDAMKKGKNPFKKGLRIFFFASSARCYRHALGIFFLRHEICISLRLGKKEASTASIAGRDMKRHRRIFASSSKNRK